MALYNTNDLGLHEQIKPQRAMKLQAFEVHETSNIIIAVWMIFAMNSCPLAFNCTLCLLIFFTTVSIDSAVQRT